jgi:hypothetical protein
VTTVSIAARVLLDLRPHPLRARRPRLMKPAAELTAAAFMKKGNEALH